MPPLNTWERETDSNAARRYPAACQIDGIAYISGGESAATVATDTHEAHNPDANTVTSRAVLPGGATAYGIKAAVGGLAYRLGGTVGATTFSDRNDSYDPATNTWTSKANMPVGTRAHSGDVIDDLIYYCGGQNSQDSITRCYDPSTNTYTAKAVMPTGRQFFGACAIAGSLHVCGNSVPNTSHDAYDPATNTWSSKAVVPGGNLSRNSWQAVENIGYLLCGARTSAPSELSYSYDPVADAWTALTNSPTHRQDHVVVAMDDGSLLAMCGLGNIRPEPDAYIAIVDRYYAADLGFREGWGMLI